MENDPSAKYGAGGLEVKDAVAGELVTAAPSTTMMTWPELVS